MTDIVNGFFRMHYPDDAEKTEPDWCGQSVEQRYQGRASTIFPKMKCADGFEMSVQGHFGAYSLPRSDFADRYAKVEIMCKREEAFEGLGRGYDVGEERIYPYTPIDVVERVVIAHGGLVP